MSVVVADSQAISFCEQRLHLFLNYYENLNFGISIPRSNTVCKMQQTNQKLINYLKFKNNIPMNDTVCDSEANKCGNNLLFFFSFF